MKYKSLNLFKIICLIVAFMLPHVSKADTLENGVLTITDLSQRYSNRTDIETVIFPNGLYTVWYATFMNCTNLKNVIFLGSIPHFNEAAFYGCNNIERVEIQPEYLASWCVSGSDYNYDHPYGTNLYLANTPVTTLEIPESVKTIGAYAFYGFKNITTVKFPSHAISVQEGGLPPATKEFYCNSLENWCNSGFQSITFNADTKLYINNQLLPTKIEIPSSVTRVGNRCFSGNCTLEEVIIPATVTDMGYGAFQGCSNLKKLTINTSNIGFQDNLFYNCSALEELIVNCGGVIGGGDKFLTGTRLKNVYLYNSALREETDITIGSIENVYIDNLSLWCENMSLLNENSKLYINNEIPKQIVIPDGVVSISDRAFLKQAYTSIEIPSSVTSIGANAMSDVENIACHASIPPTIASTTFANVDKTTAILTVPKNCASSYRTAQYWNEFANIVESTFGLDIPATAVSLSQSFVTLNVGETTELKANITPLNATDDFVWNSSNTNIAKVENGIVTTIAPGTVTINIQSLTNPSISASCEIRVIQNITSISFPKESISINVGDDYTLDVDVSPDNASNKKLKWESADASVATVSEYGNVHGVGRGTTTITATSTDGSEISSSCQVEVIQLVTGINLTTSFDTIAVGSSTRLNANVIPANANNQELNWKVEDENIAELVKDTSGFYSIVGKSKGTTNVIVSSTDGSNISSSLKIEVYNEVANLAIEGAGDAPLKIVRGETYQLNAIVTPEDAWYQDLEWWSSNPTVATVDNNGLVTAKAKGSATIYVKTIKGLEFQASIVVDIVVLTETISLPSTELTMNVDSSYDLKNQIIITPSDVSETENFTWVSDAPNIAEVSENGVVTAHTPGTVYITATTVDGTNLSVSCQVNVIKPISTISFNVSNVELIIGDTLPIDVTINPADATIRVLSWSSSNEAVATVDQTGLVTANAQGSAVITATATDGSEVSASCNITVHMLVAGITLNKTDATLNEGQTVQLTATVSPELADNKILAWSSSNEAVATVDQTGLVTAIAQGSAVITATATDGSEVSASCNITVHKLVADITLNETNATLNEGQTLQLIATVSPELADNKTLAWNSSNEAVVTVDQTGLVTAVGRGTAVITAAATDGSEVTATCNITVVNLVSGITLSQIDLTLAEGQSSKLDAVISPETAYNKTLEWASSNDAVATVDQEGNVTAIAQGSAVITASATDGSEISASCNVTVVKLVSAITLNETEIALSAGEYRILEATVLPDDATNTSLVWETTDASVARVENGVIFAIADGEATITVSASDGSNISASCHVIVRTLVSEIVLDKTEVTLKVGEFTNLNATVYPDNATNAAIEWSSSDESIATVMNGLVLAHAEGSATITASATDGSGVFAVCNITVYNESGIDNICMSDLSIFVENSTIYCKNVPAKTVVRVYQLDGTELFVVESDGSMMSFQPANYGMYIVVIKNIAEKVVVK